MIDVDSYILSKEDYDYCQEHHFPDFCDCAVHDLAVKIKALREVEKAARKIKCYADTDCVCIGITEVDEALEKLDEARRG